MSNGLNGDILIFTRVVMTLPTSFMITMSDSMSTSYIANACGGRRSCFNVLRNASAEGSEHTRMFGPYLSVNFDVRHVRLRMEKLCPTVPIIVIEMGDNGVFSFNHMASAKTHLAMVASNPQMRADGISEGSNSS